jgi:hypothetical protein
VRRIVECLLVWWCETVDAMKHPNEHHPNDAGDALDEFGEPDEIDPEFDPDPFDIDFSNGSQSLPGTMGSHRELVVLMKPPRAGASEEEVDAWVNQFIRRMIAGRERPRSQ